MKRIFANLFARSCFNSKQDVAKQIKVLQNTISEILSLNDDQRDALFDYAALFADSLRLNNNMTIHDIDTFIDWLYVTGAIVPCFTQYHRLGMNIVTTQRIYVPKTIQSLFPDWKGINDRANNAGLLLTSLRSAPSLDLWNTELSSFLPGLFIIGEVTETPDFVLERIIQVAEEGKDDRASMPEYVARLAGLPHQSESDQLRELDSQIELCLRHFADELTIPCEPPPSDFKDKIYRTIKHTDRQAQVFQWRVHYLHSSELDEMKQLLHRKPL